MTTKTLRDYDHDCVADIIRLAAECDGDFSSIMWRAANHLRALDRKPVDDNDSTCWDDIDISQLDVSGQQIERAQQCLDPIIDIHGCLPGLIQLQGLLTGAVAPYLQVAA